MSRINMHYEHRVHARPSWVIMGIDRDDGTCMLVASDNMGYAELEAKMDEFDPLMWDRRLKLMPDTRYELRTELNTIVYVIAETWFDAFAKLFGLWEPPTPQRPQLPAPAAQLPAHSD